MEGWVHHEEAGRRTTASLDAARSLHERSDMQLSPQPRGRFARPGYAGCAATGPTSNTETAAAKKEYFNGNMTHLLK